MAKMSETPTMKQKRKAADAIWKQRKRKGYRSKLWDSRRRKHKKTGAIASGTYVREVHGDL